MKTIEIIDGIEHRPLTEGEAVRLLASERRSIARLRASQAARAAAAGVSVETYVSGSDLLDALGVA
jgi:hypothetical protein